MLMMTLCAILIVTILIGLPVNDLDVHNNKTVDLVF